MIWKVGKAAMDNLWAAASVLMSVYCLGQGFFEEAVFESIAIIDAPFESSRSWIILCAVEVHNQWIRCIVYCISTLLFYTLFPWASKSDTLGGRTRLLRSFRLKNSIIKCAVFSGTSSWMKWPASGMTVS